MVKHTTTHDAKPKPSASSTELLSREAVLAFFGGDKPLHISTLYRGIVHGRYPKPVRVSGSNARWIKSECEAKLQIMIDDRDGPKPKPKSPGRPRKLPTT